MLPPALPAPVPFAVNDASPPALLRLILPELVLALIVTATPGLSVKLAPAIITMLPAMPAALFVLMFMPAAVLIMVFDDTNNMPPGAVTEAPMVILAA